MPAGGEILKRRPNFCAMRMILTCLFAFALSPAAAQERLPSHCIALSQSPVVQASWTEPLDTHVVRISYIDHSTFLIQTHDGLSAATDYTGFLGLVDLVPTVVTMNNAHETHWTSIPDPDIPHVLQGWPSNGQPADHFVDLGGMLVRNVTTDIRSRFGPGIEPDGNSIFIFETAGLCIGHLGHLHHPPTDAQYALIGRLDVVMVPVDGRMTMDVSETIEVMERFRASVVIPMHWFGPTDLGHFLAGMEDKFVIDRRDASSFTISLETLPSRPTVVVLRNEFLRNP